MGGAYSNVLASFYRAVVQAIILYGSETWVLSASMAKRIEGTHMESLQMMTGKRAKQLGDRTGFPLPLVCLLTLASPMSNILNYSLYSP